MKNIFWLASWYPSIIDPYTGDFIERHARAAMMVSKIHVLHVIKDRNRILPSKKTIEHRSYVEPGNACIIYYKIPEFRFAWFEKLYSNFIYLRIHKNYFKKYIRENGKPDGLHVHIGLKAGLAALFLHFRFRIPFVISEQWSGLCPEAKPSFLQKPLMQRQLWKMIMKNAIGYSAVSEYLASAMKKIFHVKKISIIPNVVDRAVFFPSDSRQVGSHFIHISTLKYQKNVEQIFEAATILKKRLPDLRLMIFGDTNDFLLKLKDTLNLGDTVEFKGSASQDILREHIQQSRALILYSRFETFGCVIIEANACGIPVIVSDIPVFHENVEDGLSGIFVALNNPTALADIMYSVATEQLYFDSEKIHHWVMNRYSMEKIGKDFANFYDLHF